MRTKLFFAMALFAVLLTSTWGIGSALDSFRLAGVQEDGYTINSAEEIGTGSMPSSSVEESAELSPDSSVASDEAVGTGSMTVGSDHKLEWPVGFDARPGIDGP